MSQSSMPSFVLLNRLETNRRIRASVANAERRIANMRIPFAQKTFAGIGTRSIGGLLSRASMILEAGMVQDR